MKIEFGGKERGFNWGMGCLEIFCDLMDSDLSAMEQVFVICQNQIKATTCLLYAAMQNYCNINNESQDFTYPKIQAWLDEAPQHTYTLLIEDFKKSKYLGRSIEDYFALHPANETDDQVDSQKKSL